MTSVLVTGSSDGIGREIAATLARMGHRVVLHACNEARAIVARAAVPGAAAIVIGNLASLVETRALAKAAADEGPFDVVVHNAAVSGAALKREITIDGLEHIFQVNALAPYLLTGLMARPTRLIYLTSSLEANGVVDLDDLQHECKPWDGEQAYSNSKLCMLLLAFAVARRWPKVLSNAVDPGWIRTRMGGKDAPDPLSLGAETPIWLATTHEPAARVSGRYFRRREEVRGNPTAYDVPLQDRLVEAFAGLSGVAISGSEPKHST